MSAQVRSEEGIAGVCVLRDAIDFIPFICGHYLRLGFDRLHFIDDGSVDGTSGFLAELSRGDGRITVQRVDQPVFPQGELMNEAIAAVMSEGFRIVFPFDTDEFWNIRLDSVRVSASQGSAGIFKGHWVQFIQSRDADDTSRFHLMQARHRAADLILKSPRDTTLPFVYHIHSKVGFKSGEPIVMSKGQHRLLDGPERNLASRMEVFHLPLPSLANLQARAIRNKRFVRDNPREGWQSEKFCQDVESGEIAGVWAASTADDRGCLDLRGRQHPLIPDDRLRTALLRAWFFMLRHHPRLLFAAQRQAAAKARNARAALGMEKPVLPNAPQLGGSADHPETTGSGV